MSLDTSTSSLRARAEQRLELLRCQASTFTTPLQKTSRLDMKTFLTTFYETIWTEQKRQYYEKQMEQYPRLKEFYQDLVVTKNQLTYEDFWERYEYRCDLSRVIYSILNEEKSEIVQAVVDPVQTVRKATLSLSITPDPLPSRSTLAVHDRTFRIQVPYDPVSSRDTNFADSLTSGRCMTPETSAKTTAAMNFKEATNTNAIALSGSDAEESKAIDLTIDVEGSLSNLYSLEISPRKSEAPGDVIYTYHEEIHGGPKSENLLELGVKEALTQKPAQILFGSDTQRLHTARNDTDSVETRGPPLDDYFLCDEKSKRDVTASDNVENDGWEKPISDEQDKKLMEDEFDVPFPCTPCHEDSLDSSEPTDTEETARSSDDEMIDLISSSPECRTYGKKEHYTLNLGDMVSPSIESRVNSMRSLHSFQNRKMLIMLLVGPVVCLSVLGLIQRSIVAGDFLCGPIQPGFVIRSLAVETSGFSAPWWVPEDLKPTAFSLLCAPQNRARTEIQVNVKAKQSYMTVTVIDLDTDQSSLRWKRLRSIELLSGEMQLRAETARGKVSTHPIPWKSRRDAVVA